MSDRQYVYTSLEVRDALRAILGARMVQERTLAQQAPADSPARAAHLVATQAHRDALCELAEVFGFDPPQGWTYPEVASSPAAEAA